jgi:hypothetical protein
MSVPHEASGETGAAADGLITAVVAGGRLATLTLDGRVMRLSAAELSAGFAVAINAAFADVPPAAYAADQAPDVAALREALRRISGDGTVALERIALGIDAAVRGVSSRAGMSGDPYPHGLAALLDETRSVLARAGTRAELPDDARGSGSGADGMVRAVVAPGPVVERIFLDARALRLASVDLAEQVVVAVNVALAELGEAGQLAGSGGVSADELRVLQQRGVEQMRAYTGSLRAIMSSIQDPA